jgi:hypothetical protein
VFGKAATGVGVSHELEGEALENAADGVGFNGGFEKEADCEVGVGLVTDEKAGVGVNNALDGIGFVSEADAPGNPEEAA